MQLEVINTLNELQALAPEWNDLLACCGASHVPFLRNEYLCAWWSSLGGGEWEQGELHVVIARQENGQLAGIAPLFSTRNREAEPALMLLGSIEISDYLDFIVRPSLLADFAVALLELLERAPQTSYRVLDLYNLLEDSLTLRALEEAAGQRGWDYNQQKLSPCPYIPLPADWEAYLAGVDKKQRHEIRRKMRRAESSLDPVRWYFVEDGSQLDSEIGAFLALMAQDPKKERFLTPSMREAMRLIMQAAFQGGWLQLSFMEVGGVKVAGYLNFDYAGHIWVYNSGFSSQFSELSPGWVLLSYLLKWSNDNGRLAFDFMRGGEDYKYRFGAVDRYVVRATLRRP
jgi:CelD/BcsL family acetyltransferase involved in cellulose biosynthesis